MHARTSTCADFDWLLAWPSWTTRTDQRLEAVFALDAFLQRSQAGRSTWMLDFLSWKCERLAVDGCWFEVGLEHRADRTDVRVVMDR